MLKKGPWGNQFFSHNGKTSRQGWLNSRCSTHDIGDKAAFLCKNPFYGITSCSADSDCGSNGICDAYGLCVPSISVESPGRTCDANYDCPIGEGPCSTQNGDGYCTGVEANGCTQDTDCNTGACLAGACVAKESVPKGGFCDSDAECASSAICNQKEGVNRCDSRLPRGIKLSYCDNDSQRNQNGVK